MRNFALALLAATAASCAPPVVPPQAEPVGGTANAQTAAADDGTYLGRIDPLGGQWVVERLAGENFRRFDARIDFMAGGFLNHGAGCGGGHPAFYRLDGARLAITRREPVRTGKCEKSPAGPAAAAASERALGSFLDRAASWERRGDTLLLRDARGGEAMLTRPVEPLRDFAGRWLIESIGGSPFVTELPASLTISRGVIAADADCNRLSANFSVPRPGVIAIAGGVIGTQRGCAAQDLAEDRLMASTIGSATSYRLERDRLVIGGGPGMVLRRPPAPDRRLAGEYEHCGNTLLGGYHEGPVTLRFDGRQVTDNAGCTADYTSEGPALTLRLSGAPACAARATPFVPGEPIPIGGAISTLAVARPDGFGFTDTGVLVLRTARGLLTLCRKGSPRPFGSG